MQLLDVPERLCLFTTDYCLVFLLNEQKLFSVTTEERIVQAKVVDLQQPFVSIRGTVYHGQLLFVLDEVLNWSLFGFGRSNQAHKQRFREVLSSKQLGLFDYVQVVSNKQRKTLKCMVSRVKLSSTRVVLELQLNVCMGWSTSLVFDTTEKETNIRRILQDLTASLAYEHVLQDRQLVGTVSSPVTAELNEGPLLKAQEFYTKVAVLKEPTTDNLSLYTFMIGRDNYSLHVGRNILCNVGSSLNEIFFIEKSSTVMLCIPNSIVLYGLRNNKTSTHEFKYTSIIEIENGVYLACLGENGMCMLLEVAEGPTLIAKILLKELKCCQALVPTSSKLNEFYMLDREGSIHLLKTEQGKSGLVTEVYHNDESRVVSARNYSDKYGGLLSITKRVGQVNQTELLSNQPHAQLLLTLQHSLPSLELCNIISVENSPTLLLTHPCIGTAFIDCFLQDDKLVVRNSEDYQKWQTKQPTLLFKRSTNQTIQVTETKILLQQQQQAIKTVETRSLFDNMNIALDRAVLLNCDRILGLVIREQLHLYTLERGRPEPLFIYCFDLEVQCMFPVSDYQLLAVKLFGRNCLDFYFVDTQQQTLSPLNSIVERSELHIKCAYPLPIQINTQHYLVNVVIRKNNSPLLLFAPNEPTSKRCKEVLWCEFRALPSDYGEHIVQLRGHHDTDKHVLMARDLFVAFPRSCIVEGPVTNLTVQCMRSNRSHDCIEPPLWIQQTSKPNVYVQLSKRHVLLWEDTYRKVSRHIETHILESYNVQIEIEKASPTLSLVHIHAYSETADLANPLFDENFSKIITIKTIESSIAVDQENSKLPRSIACLALDGLPDCSIKWLKGPIVLLYSPEEVWLARFVLKAGRFSLAIYSRFSLPNDAFMQFQNKLPRSDLDNPQFMDEFKKRHTIRQLEPLDCSKLFTLGSNYLIALLAKSLLVLQLDQMVFKIHQSMEIEEEIDTVLDNFRPRSVYMRGSNHLYLLTADTNMKFSLNRQQELDDTIVFASTIDSWVSRWRSFRARTGEPLSDSTSTIIVKQFGQLEVRTTDRHGTTTESDMYV